GAGRPSAVARALVDLDIVRRAGDGARRAADWRRDGGSRRAPRTAPGYERGGGDARRGLRVRAERSGALLGPFAAVALLGTCIALSAANVRPASFSWLAYVLANLIVYTDALDFLLRL